MARWYRLVALVLLCGGTGCDASYLHDVLQIAPPASTDIPPLAVETLAADLEQGVELTLTGSDQGVALAALTASDGTSTLVELSGSALASRVALAYAREADECNLARPELDVMPGTGCPAGAEDRERYCEPRMDGTVPPTRQGAGRACSFAAVALGPTVGGSAFAAVVNDAGCNHGQLRLGAVELQTAHLVLRGPPLRSNAFLGVDLGASLACTGADAPGGCPARGVSGLALAGDVRPPECPSLDCAAVASAYVAWVDDSRACRLDCGAPVADLRGLGGFLERDRSGGVEIASVLAAGDADTIGRTTGGTPPAVAPWPIGGGFLIAYADANGGLAISRVATSTAPPRVPPPPTAVALAVARSTAPFGPPEVVASVPSQGLGPIEHVQLAVGRFANDEVQIGLSWTEGCDAPRAVLFAQVIASLSGGSTATRIARVSNLGTPEAPALAYAPTGMASLGSERAGTIISPVNDGGWTILFVEGSGVRAVRILEVDGQIVNEPTVTVSTQPSARQLRAYPTGSNILGGARFVYVDEANRNLIGGELTWSPAR